MQKIFEQPLYARGIVGVAASAIVVFLVHAAMAHDNAGVMQFFNANPAPAASQAAASSVPVAAELRTTIPDGRSLTVHASIHKPVRTRVAARKAPLKVSAAPIDFTSIPNKPAVVSIFEDRTLRPGDAVMTYAGIRIFAGSKQWPYRPHDFMALAAVKTMDLHLRKTLAEIDSLPREPLISYDQFAIRTNVSTQ